MQPNASTSIYRYFQWDSTTACAGQPDELQLENLQQQGMAWIINLGLLNTDYALVDEAGVVDRLGMQYRHIPVPWEAPRYANFLDFLAVMNESHGQQRLIHCAANCRASVFVAMYYYLVQGQPYDDVIAKVTSIWQPNFVWQRMIETILSNQQISLQE